LLLPLFEAGELDAEDEPPDWSCPTLRSRAEERRLLRRVADAAMLAMRHQSKLRAIRKLISRISEPLVVFTEYRDTLVHLRDAVAPDAAIIHGGLSRQERRRALEAFTRGRKKILMATDAAGEGLNLHHTCRIIINLELPWNPMRLEQRIGRVDRIGQKRRVHAFHLLAANTREMDLLTRLHGRIDRAQQDIGGPDPLGDAGAPPSFRPTATIEAAGREHRRLILSRSVAARSAGDHDDGDAGTFACLTHRRTVRTRLGESALVIKRTVLRDETGRSIASRLTPLRVHFSGRRHVRSKSALLRLVLAADAVGIERIDPGWRSWLERCRSVHQSFWATRIHRELAIQQALEDAAPDRCQPGLFSTRRVVEHRSQVQQAAAAREAAARRVVSAQRSGALVEPVPSTPLVLVP
jgi:hypothetical protein